MVAALISLVLGVASSAVVLVVGDFKRRWPWRVVRLGIGPDHSSAVRREPFGVSLDQGDARAPFARRASLRRVVRRTEASRLDQGSRSSAKVAQDVPFTADLLLVAVSAGHSIHGAIEVVSRFGHGFVAQSLGECWRRFQAGSPLGSELRLMSERLGEDVRALCGTLNYGLTSGGALEPALQRLADRERRRLKRRTEERIRRLPIMLLVPLVLFVLPSFVALTILPVLLVSASRITP